MRLFLPEQIPLSYAGVFAGALFLLQLLDHTGLYFASCSFLFVLVATIAFNRAGGLTRPSGGYVFFYALLAVIFGLCVKVALGQPGDSNLLQPRLTITVHLVGVTVMIAAVSFSRRFARRKPLLAGALTEDRMVPASIGCLIVGASLILAQNFVTRTSGGIWSALFQMNRFTELAIILNVLYTIRRSGGRVSMSAPGYIGSGVLFVIGGILGFSKEGLFTPIVCWFLAACASQVQLSRSKIIAGALLIYSVNYFFVPYSQYGRAYSTGSTVGNIAVATSLLSNLSEVRTIYVTSEKESVQEGFGGYFNRPSGILDRLQMLGPDDALIAATERNGPYGYYPILEDVEALVPHVFWPDKPNNLWGNTYAHEAGIPIPEDDYTTGVSFSPVGEGYHLGLWVGVGLLCPVVWSCAFWIFESLCGDARIYPWSLLTLLYFAHVAPEGYLGGLIYSSFYFAVAITFAALTIGFIMPVLGTVFLHRNSAPLSAFLPAQPASVPRDELAL